VDDEIAVIHQYPLGSVVALKTDRQLAHFLELFPDLVGDGMRLPRICNRADDEEIGK
jgi:hypothetical protein